MSSSEGSRPHPTREGWIPLAAAALDVTGHPHFATGVEVVVVPPEAGPALGLHGEGARLWRELTRRAPVPDGALTEIERAVARDLRDIGLVAYGTEHPACFRELRVPVLSSPLHELVYGVVGHVAGGLGIRCVFIKGPALHRQGLRSHEHSGDVDVWCDPRHWDELADALTRWGWRREPDPWRGTTVNHSATLVPVVWGCEIDVHRRVPGMTIDDDAAFAVIASDTVSTLHAGVSIDLPATAPHAVIAALHAARPEVGRAPRTPQAVAASAEMLARVPGAVDAVRALGAVPALGAELAAMSPVPLGPEVADGTPRDWAWRDQPDRVRAYLAAMGDEPLPTRIRLLARLIWPPADIARESARRAGEPTDRPLRARLRRLRRGLGAWLSTARGRPRR